MQVSLSNSENLSVVLPNFTSSLSCSFLRNTSMRMFDPPALVQNRRGIFGVPLSHELPIAPQADPSFVKQTHVIAIWHRAPGDLCAYRYGISSRWYVWLLVSQCRVAYDAATPSRAIIELDVTNECDTPINLLDHLDNAGFCRNYTVTSSYNSIIKRSTVTSAAKPATYCLGILIIF